MKILSWSVSGLKSRKYEDTDTIVRSNEYDFMLLQKIQTREDTARKYIGDRMTFAVWNEAEIARYNGTGILTRNPGLVLSASKGMGGEDLQGRVSTVELENAWLVSAFAPSIHVTREQMQRQPEMTRELGVKLKRDWMREFTAYLEKLDAVKPVIAGANLQCSLDDRDVFNPEYCEGKAGYTEEEREDLQALLDAGFTDAYRAQWPDRMGVYDTWTSERMRRADQGSRRNFILISNRLMPAVTDCSPMDVETMLTLCVTNRPYTLTIDL